MSESRVTSQILSATPTKKYTRPDDLPGRVCRVLQGITILEMQEDPFASLVYRFTHIASGRCGNPHEDWMEEFCRTEEEIEEAAYTSPAGRRESQ